MISETNFENLELLKRNETEIEEQVYEEVTGFESLNSKLQTRTTAFTCKSDSEDYDEKNLMSRSLPWVVRVFFKLEDSMKGILCSGNVSFYFNQLDLSIYTFQFHLDYKNIELNFQQLLLIIIG